MTDTRTYTREDLRDLANAIVPVANLAPDMDPGDLWGSVMGLWFDIAEILYYRGEEIPEEWEYRRGMSIDAEELNGLLVSYESDYLRLLGNRCHRAAATLRDLELDY